MNLERFASGGTALGAPGGGEGRNPEREEQRPTSHFSLVSRRRDTPTSIASRHGDTTDSRHQPD
eukprot:scaffold952_cov249-Pinguiococcus_pyrenoidosus.AAC.25